MKEQEMLFIIGTGRSGTHWIARLLQSHRECAGLIEVDPIFSYATRMALNPALCEELMPKLIAEYRAEAAKVAPKLFFDKSHPNIWHAQTLAEIFPNARFIGTDRSVFGTVASMLKHGGVQDWIRRWREYPVPNRFLGIDESNKDAYASLSLAQQCALRWESHNRRMQALIPLLGGKLHIVNYESLHDDPPGELEKMRRFLNLQSDFPPPEIKKISRDLWKTELSREQIAQIERVVSG
jgi:hypothetical protein